MNDEKFLIIDHGTIKSKKNGKTYYYIVVYSSLTQNVEKVFVTYEDYDYIITNFSAIDPSVTLHRVYSRVSNSFVINFTRV